VWQNYSPTEHNACSKLRHGRLNHVFELAGMSYQPHLEPIACTSKNARPQLWWCNIRHKRWLRRSGRKLCPVRGTRPPSKRMRWISPSCWTKNLVFWKVGLNLRGSVLVRKPRQQKLHIGRSWVIRPTGGRRPQSALLHMTWLCWNRPSALLPINRRRRTPAMNPGTERRRRCFCAT
jgi:hypothetical protein